LKALPSLAYCKYTIIDTLRNEREEREREREREGEKAISGKNEHKTKMIERDVRNDACGKS
jgi:hypothetical protein